VVAAVEPAPPEELFELPPQPAASRTVPRARATNLRTGDLLRQGLGRSMLPRYRATAKPSPERMNLVTGANQASIASSDIAIPGGLTPSGGV